MVELQPIIAFSGRHFVRHLGINNRICVKRIPLMCAVIAHNSVKKEVVILINDRDTTDYSTSRPLFVRHRGGCNRIGVNLI